MSLAAVILAGLSILDSSFLFAVVALIFGFIGMYNHNMPECAKAGVILSLTEIIIQILSFLGILSLISSFFPG